ncbi:hypothetical protein PG997_011741 [Apiospora hydei]|uniref:Uncharacterized protein n=1 Tax=Apiospora hydei TaxID=1337664 RepID=A0ABR1V1D1_9PEZI
MAQPNQGEMLSQLDLESLPVYARVYSDFAEKGARGQGCGRGPDGRRQRVRLAAEGRRLRARSNLPFQYLPHHPPFEGDALRNFKQCLIAFVPMRTGNSGLRTGNDPQETAFANLVREIYEHSAPGDRIRSIVTQFGVWVEERCGPQSQWPRDRGCRRGAGGALAAEEVPGEGGGGGGETREGSGAAAADSGGEEAASEGAGEEGEGAGGVASGWAVMALAGISTHGTQQPDELSNNDDETLDYIPRASGRDAEAFGLL